MLIKSVSPVVNAASLKASQDRRAGGDS